MTKSGSARVAITLGAEDLDILDKFASEWKMKRATAASMMLSQMLELTKSIGTNLVEMEKQLNEKIDKASKK